MKANQKLVGKVFSHPVLRKVIVDNVHGKSRVLVDVTVIDRGDGWDEIKQQYTGIRTTYVNKRGEVCSHWRRGENHSYGEKDTVHMNSLS